MFARFHRNRIVSLIAALAALASVLPPRPVLACPFCNAVSQTLRQEMAAMDAVVIGSSLQDATQRDAETGKLRMKVEKVLKGGELVKAGDEIDAIYFALLRLRSPVTSPRFGLASCYGVLDGKPHYVTATLSWSR